MSLARAPYSDIESVDVEKYLADGYRLVRPPGCPEELYDLIARNCWQYNPDKRPDPRVILQSLHKIQKKWKIKYTDTSLTTVTRVVKNTPNRVSVYQIYARYAISISTSNFQFCRKIVFFRFWKNNILIEIVIAYPFFTTLTVTYFSPMLFMQLLYRDVRL